MCTASPERGKAFCMEHCTLLQRDAPTVPTDIKEFLKFCGAHTGMIEYTVANINKYLCWIAFFGMMLHLHGYDIGDEESVGLGDDERVDRVINSIRVQNDVGETAAESQGSYHAWLATSGFSHATHID